MLMSWCHSGVRIVSHPDMGIMNVHNTVPCKSRLISKRDVSYKLCVYKAFCEKPLAKHRPHTMVRRSEVLHSLDVVRVKWLFMENSPDKGNTDTFCSRNSSHTGSGIFFHSSQYANFSKTRPYLSRHWFLDICWLGHFCPLKWEPYTLKPVILLTSCMYVYIYIYIYVCVCVYTIVGDVFC
jgi:hypothetical protein